MRVKHRISAVVFWHRKIGNNEIKLLEPQRPDEILLVFYPDDVALEASAFEVCLHDFSVDCAVLQMKYP